MRLCRLSVTVGRSLVREYDVRSVSEFEQLRAYLGFGWVILLEG